ncbi:MAG: glycosyltransferase family 4 protein [Bacteroidia bacterium]
MKILHLIAEMNAGGAENIAAGLAEAAVARGHQAGILTILPGNEYETRLQASGIRFDSLNYSGGFGVRRMLFLSGIRQELMEKIRAFQPDIIHSHLFIPTILLFRAAGKLPCPVVHTQHDNCPWWYKKDLKSRFQTAIEKRYAQSVASVSACISRSVKADVENILKINPEKAPLVYNFIRFPENMPRPADLSRKPFRILMLTRLDMEKKGIDLGLQIFRNLLADIPDAQLVITGKGQDETRIRELAATLQVEGKVDFRGYQSDIYAEFERAHIVLMPSRWEGFGLVAAEAGAAGRPVVASDAGGLPEVIRHNHTGIVCASGDVQAFTKAILTLNHDPDGYARLAQAAQEFVRAQFGIERAFQQYMDIYQKLIPQHKTSSVV